MNYIESLYEGLDSETRETLSHGEFRKLVDASLPSERNAAHRVWLLYALTGIARGREARAIIEARRSLEGARVLDYGCGDGGHSIACAEVGADVTSIDIDVYRLERAAAQARDFGVAIETATGGSYAADLPSNSFDVIICNDVIEHVNDPSALAASHARLLRPDGMLFLTVPNRFSVPALRADMHYRLPLLSVMNRQLGAFYVVKVMKRDDEYTLNRLLGWREVHAFYKSAKVWLECVSDKWAMDAAKAQLGFQGAGPFGIAPVAEKVAARIRRYLYDETWAFIGYKYD